MVLRSLRPMLVAALLTAAFALGNSAEAFERTRVYPRNDIAYNYYTNGPATPAQMYVSPLPAPAWVGHTYITYQPLLPQAWMNPHANRYVRYAPGHPIVPVNYTRVAFW